MATAKRTTTHFLKWNCPASDVYDYIKTDDWIQVHRHADHPDVIVQIHLAGGMIRLVGGDAVRLTELAEERVQLLKGVARVRVEDARDLRRPIRLSQRLQRVAITPERDLLGFCEQCVLELLGITIQSLTLTGIHPAAAEPPWLDVFEIPHDAVALVRLEVHDGVFRVPRFGAGVDHVEHLRLRFEVVARELVLFVPIRRLDNEMDLRVDALGVLDDEVLAHFLHDLQAILGPAHVSLGLLAQLAPAIEDEQIVKNDFVEEACGVCDQFAEPLTIIRFREAEARDAISGPADVQHHAAGCLEALAGEEVFDLPDVRLRCLAARAVGLQPHLVHLHGTADDVPTLFHPLRVGHHAAHVLD